MIPIPLRDNCLLIDNSTLEVFTTCPRAAEYYFCRKRESSATRPALHFGDAIHRALAVRYASEAPYLQTPDIEAKMIQTVEKQFQDYTPPDGEFRTLSFGVELINSYGAEYPLEGFTVLPGWVEKSFALPIGELDIEQTIPVLNPDTLEITEQYVSRIVIVWTGKLDLLIYVPTADGIFVMDHKTTSMLGPTFFKDFELSHAMHGYGWAAQQLLNQPIKGYQINAIATRKPTKTGNKLEFVRQSYSPTPEHLDEWRQDTLTIVSDFVACAVRGYMPKHTKWCMAKYGECQYHKVCTLKPDHRDLMLSSGEYSQVTWSPLNHD